jgi:uncharacterized protein with HEPN domain
MTAERTPEERLADIELATGKIESFLRGRSFEDFSNDAMLHDAVVRNLEIISEASRHLGDRLKTAAPEVPWRKVADMGNWIRHAYEKVEDRILWETIQDGLPVLAAAVNRLRNAQP